MSVISFSADLQPFPSPHASALLPKTLHNLTHTDWPDIFHTLNTVCDSSLYKNQKQKLRTKRSHDTKSHKKKRSFKRV